MSSPHPLSPLPDAAQSVASTGVPQNAAYAVSPAATLSGPAPAPAPEPAGSNNPTHTPSGLVHAARDIHMQGMFYSFDANDYLTNDTAIKALLNEKNALQEQLDASADPKLVKFATILGAVVNIIATTFVGIGINLTTGDNVPKYAGLILVLGVLLAAVGTIGPILAAFTPRKK